uniref:Uncharacterized protein n=1 Tax=viral metagenome TaxID=1070528 RepID=A0A6C0L785_9ZZZZ
MFNRLMKLKYNFNPILHNRIILYFFFAIALIDLVYFLNIGDMYSFSVIILVGMLTSFFVKNMIVILFVAIVVTHLLKHGRSSFSEGMEGMDEDIVETDKKKSASSDKKKSSTSDKKPTASLKDFSKNIEEIISKEEDPEQNELIEQLPEIKETRDKIVNHVKDMQPLLEKFQGYIDKFNDYNASGK